MTDHHRQLEQRFPLTTRSTDPIRGLDTEPQKPLLFTGFDEAWRRMPLAKKRLLVYGSTTTGHNAVRLAAWIIGAECRALGVPIEVAEQLVKSMPFVANDTPRRKTLAELPIASRKGYLPPNGIPFLTGCCRDPRGSTNLSTARLALAPYCDGACAESCLMLKAIRNPDRAIDDTEYAHIDASDLWMPGSQYGKAGRRIYQQLALRAALDPKRQVWATARYLCKLLDGELSTQHIRDVLARFDKDGLVPVLKKRRGQVLRHVPVLTREQLSDLEHRLGVAGKRAANLRDAGNASEAYHNHVRRMLSALDDWTL